MALTATMYLFEVELADSDRGIYETLELRAAMHPSETADYLLTRVLAWCLEYREGIAFSKGLSDPDEPTLFARDLTGAFTLWVEIGTPDAARLHKAAKASPEVAVYCHKDARHLASRLAGEKIHRQEDIALYAFDRDFLARVLKHLSRRMRFTLTVAERHLYLSVDGNSYDSVLERIPLG